MIKLTSRDEEMQKAIENNEGFLVQIEKTYINIYAIKKDRNHSAQLTHIVRDFEVFGEIVVEESEDLIHLHADFVHPFTDASLNKKELQRCLTQLI